MKGVEMLAGLEFLPAPVEVLRSLQLAAALLFVVPANLALGLPLLTFFAEGLGAGRGDTSLRRLAAWLGRRTPGLVAMAIVFSFPVFLLNVTLYGEAILPAAQQMGWLMLSIIPLLFVGLGGAFWVALRRRGTEPSTMRPFLPDVVESYILAFRRRGLERPGMALTAVSALALLGMGFVLGTHAVIVENPELWAPGAARPSGMLLPLRSPQWLPRLLHMFLAALAVSGFAVAWHGADRIGDGETGYGKTALRFGVTWFMVPTALQLIAGPWLMFSLSPEVPPGPVGGVVPFMALVMTGAACGVLATVLVGASLAARDPRTVIRTAAALLVCAVAAMIAARQHVRAGLLDELVGLSGRATSAQPEMTVLFAVVAGMSALVVLYMLAVAPRSPAQES